MTFKPMLACSKIPNLDDDIEYPVYTSPKLDGVRCIIGPDGKAYSRTMKLIPNKHIQDTLQKLKLPRLDGELMLLNNEPAEGCVLGEQGEVVVDFNSVQSAVMRSEGKPNFKYAVFDLVLSGVPFWERQTKLKLMCEYYRMGPVQYVPHYKVETADELYKEWELFLNEGHEGAIVRSVNGPYKEGRSTMKEGYMLKLKKFHDDEATIVGCEELMRNTDTSTKQLANLYGADMLGALIVEWKGKEFKIGSGFDEATRKSLWAVQNQLIGKQVTFKYQEVSRYGIPRFPVFKALRDGY